MFDERPAGAANNVPAEQPPTDVVLISKKKC